MNPDRELWWVPTYKSRKEHLVVLNDLATNECPVSSTSGWMLEMLNEYIESTRFHGAHMYGTNLSEWPADVYDAFSIFMLEENMAESAKWDSDKQGA